MINLRPIILGVRKAVADNSPALLTAMGVAGFVTTAALAAKGSFQAAEVLKRDSDQRDVRALTDSDVFPAELKEQFQMTWKYYIPAVGVGLTSALCVISAQRIGTRRVTAMASAYTLSQRAFEEYKDKVLEKFGEKKEASVREEIAKDRVNAAVANTLLVPMTGDYLVCDLHSDRVFRSNMNDLEKAVNDTNSQILNDGYASLTDFYDRVGLRKTAESDDIGWNSDRQLRVDYTSVLSADGRPCIAIGFKTVPNRRFSHFS